MIIVKITILLVLITAVYIFFWSAWLKNNPGEIILSNHFKEYVPKGGYVAVILLILSIIGIFASVIWGLFFR